MAIIKIKKFLVDEGIPHSNRQIFRHEGVPEASGRKVLEAALRPNSDEPPRTEHRGHGGRRLTEDDVDLMENYLWNGGFDARALPWERLPAESGCDFTLRKPPSTRTIMRTIGHRKWRRCTVCSKGWTSKEHAEERVKGAFDALSKRPNPQDWDDVRFSDECQFSFGPERQVKVLRKAGERECPDCIQYRTQATRERSQPRVHCWGVVGVSLWEPLIWCEVKSTSEKDGTLSQHAYINNVLDPVVKKWLLRGDKFVLKEDGASGHNPHTNGNIVKMWRERHGLVPFTDTPRSPDLSPMENAWRAPKAYIFEHAVWDIDAIKDCANNAWESLKDESANQWIRSMPQRCSDVIRLDGQLTNWS